MTRARKVKVSLTLSADLVARADRDAKVRADTRSGVIERWLRRAIREDEAARLEAETIAYYDSLTAADVEEEESLSNALSDAARALVVEDEGNRPSARDRLRPATRKSGP
jgi:metal-responsive CopG/Arc/MetJ family transcriptional regulator